MQINMKLFFLPTWTFKFLPIFKKFTALQGEAFDICKRHVDAAIARVEDADENVIAKLVRSCGPDSPVPLIMGADALQVVNLAEYSLRDKCRWGLTQLALRAPSYSTILQTIQKCRRGSMRRSTQ